MKKNVIYIISVIICFITFSTSCSIYEELYFAEDGQVKYQLIFDGKELMKSTPNPNDSTIDMTVKDSIISIADIINANKDIKKTLYPQEKEDLNNISAFVVRKYENPVKKEYTFSISGEFANAETLNKALFSLNRLVGSVQNSSESSLNMQGTKLMDQSTNVSQYKWDGTTMNRYTVEAETMQANDKNEEDEIGKIMRVTNPFTSFLMGGKMTIKYHFPVKVDKIDNKEAMLSQDGKSVIANYQATTFTESPEDANINITVKK